MAGNYTVRGYDDQNRLQFESVVSGNICTAIDKAETIEGKYSRITITTKSGYTADFKQWKAGDNYDDCKSGRVTR